MQDDTLLTVMHELVSSGDSTRSTSAYNYVSERQIRSKHPFNANISFPVPNAHGRLNPAGYQEEVDEGSSPLAHTELHTPETPKKRRLFANLHSHVPENLIFHQHHRRNGKYRNATRL